jgi:hypothetical protein
MNGFERGSPLTGNFCCHSQTIIKRIAERKKIEVVCFPMPQIKACQRRAPCQKEAVFTREESVEKILLQDSQSAICQ